MIREKEKELIRIAGEKKKKIEKLRILHERNRGKESLIEFVKLVWKYSEAGKEYEHSWYIEAICEHLEALYRLEIRNLIVQIAPRHGKSTLCSVIYPVWIWLQDPRFKILNAAYGDDLAKRDCMRSRGIINTMYFQQRWGDLFNFDKAEDELKNMNIDGQKYYKNNKGGYRLSTSVGGKGTGLGSDLQIIDDPHKAQEFDSDTKLMFTHENWFKGTMASRYEDTNTFRRMVIHQRGNKNDLIGMILQEEPEEWCVLKLPVEYIPTTYVTAIGWKDPRTVEGEWLDERRISKEAGLKIKRNSPKKWHAQYQQEPEFTNTGWINERELRKHNIHNIPATRDFDYFVSSWDLKNGSVAKEASDGCGIIWGGIGRRKMIVDMTLGKWTFPQQLSEFIRMKKKHPQCRTHLIEVKASGKPMIQMLQQYIKNKEYGCEVFSEDLIVKIDPRHYGGDKIKRFEAALHEFRDNNIWTLDPDYYGEPAEEIIKAICGMPYTSKKDIPDTVSQFINWITLFKDEVIMNDRGKDDIVTTIANYQNEYVKENVMFDRGMDNMNLFLSGSGNLF